MAFTVNEHATADRWKRLEELADVNRKRLNSFFLHVRDTIAETLGVEEWQLIKQKFLAPFPDVDEGLWVAIILHPRTALSESDMYIELRFKPTGERVEFVIKNWASEYPPLSLAGIIANHVNKYLYSYLEKRHESLLLLTGDLSKWES